MASMGGYSSWQAGGNRIVAAPTCVDQLSSSIGLAYRSPCHVYPHQYALHTSLYNDGAWMENARRANASTVCMGR